MKKLLSLFLFFIINIVSFSTSKGTYDENRFRQDVIRYAISNLNVPYSRDRRMQNGYFDCSSYVGRAVRSAGMSGGVNGNEGSWASTTDAMRGNVRNVSFDTIKPGDTLNFSKGPYCCGHVVIVLENLGNGKFRVAHAGSPSQIETINNIKTWRNGTYIGSISATQILINNGYTPVNSDGTVIVPEAGSININPDGERTTGTRLEDKYDFSWEEYQEEFLEMIFEASERLKNFFGSLLALLTVIQILKSSIPYFFNRKGEEYIIETGITVLKFSYILYIINNSRELINWAYKFFSGIGLLFVENKELHSLDALFAVTWKEAVKVLKLINDYQISWFRILFLPSNFMDEDFYKTLVLIVIFFMIMFITASIMFNLISIMISFFLGNELSLFNLCFGTLDYTKDIGRRPLRTLMATGIRLSILVIFNSILFNALDKSNFGDYTLQTITFERMFSFIIVGVILSILLFKIDSIVDKI